MCIRDSAWHTRRLKIDQNKALSPFLVYLLADSSTRLKVESVATQTALTGMTVKDLFSVDLNLPPLPEQKKIVSILTSMDATIEEKQRKLSQTQSLKKSLMQDLLTGKVRVNVN